VNKGRKEGREGKEGKGRVHAFRSFKKPQRLNSILIQIILERLYIGDHSFFSLVKGGREGAAF